MLVGSHGVWISLVSLVVFKKLGIGIGQLFSLLSHVFFFGVSLGALPVEHIIETCPAPAVSLGTMVLFGTAEISLFIIPIMIEQLGIDGCFSIFAVGTFIGAIYLHLFFKDTTYFYRYIDEVDQDGKVTQIRVKHNLTEKEKKELYWPDDLKS